MINPKVGAPVFAIAFVVQHFILGSHSIAVIGCVGNLSGQRRRSQEHFRWQVSTEQFAWTLVELVIEKKSR